MGGVRLGFAYTLHNFIEMLLVVFVLFLPSYSVFCQSPELCFDCCTDKVLLYGLVEMCQSKEWCEKGIWGEREGVLKILDLRGLPVENATYAKVFPNGISNSIRRCTIQNFEKLETIYGENSDIGVVEIRAFWNLTKLKSIYLAFNQIREVQYGVFSFLPISFLDLSWNKIGFIGEKSFTGMNNLLTLNVSHNELTTLDIFEFTLPLKTLIASHNFLENFDKTYELNITTIDLSFNKIKYFITLFQKTYEKIDLTNNYLSNLQVSPETAIDDFRISLNNMTDIKMLAKDDVKIKKITIFPNPWNCKEVDNLTRHLIEHNTTIINPKIDLRLNFSQNAYVICLNPNEDSFFEYQKSRPSCIRGESTICKDDSQCPSFMICRTGTCWDPCKHNACRTEATECSVYKHKYTCKCQKGEINHPYELFSSCYSLCFTRDDCAKGRYCGIDHICRRM